MERLRGSWSRAVVLAAVWAGLGFGLTLLLAAPAAAAQEPAPRPIDISVRHAPELQTEPNFVRLVVDVTYADTGERPVTDEEFFVLVSAESADTETESFGCAPRTITDNRAPNGLYDCSVIVNQGATWTFRVVVNEPTVPGEVPVQLGQETLTLDITAPTLQGLDEYLDDPEARWIDVALNLFHTAAGGAWFAVAGALALLAVPRLRALISDRARHYLETHLSSVIAALWTTTLLVGGSGIFLAMNRTAYDAPWTPDDVNRVFDLPYGQEYFLSLWTKIAVFVVIVVMSITIQREAQRRQRAAASSGPFGTSADDAPSPWNDSELAEDAEVPMSGGGGVGTLTPIRRGSPARAPAVASSPKDRTRLVSVATGIIALGGAVIVVCVGLLLYYHILIEAALAEFS